MISPSYGMGVDNVAEVELVAADGSLVVANARGTRYQLPGMSTWTFTTDTDLFFAVRGGGGSSWGVITHVTYFVHFLPPGIQTAKFEMVGKISELPNAYSGLGKWTVGASRKWSYYTTVYTAAPGPCVDQDADVEKAIGYNCSGIIRKLNLTAEDHCNVRTLDMAACDEFPLCRASPAATVSSLASETCRVACDSCWDWVFTVSTTYLGKSTDVEYIQEKAKLSEYVGGNTLSVVEQDYGQNYAALVMSDTSEGIVPQWNAAVVLPQVNVPARVLNSTLWTDTLSKLAMQSRQLNGTASQAFYKTFADGFIPSYSAPSALQPEFRKAALWVANAGIGADMPNATQELYKLGNSSYFSESLYDMDNWQERYWGAELATRLESIKRKWDPEMVFHCRHCIGDRMTPQCGHEGSLPPRASCLPSVTKSSARNYPELVVV